MPPDSSHSGPENRPPDDRQADDFWGSFRLLRYSHIFASAVREILELKFLRQVCPEGLTPSQFHLLQLMCHNGEHQIGEVAHFLGVSPPAATKNIDKLERLGLVVRTRSTGDRRATLLSSSEKGRRLVQDYERLKAAQFESILERFDQQELDQLADLLERFSVNLLEMADLGKGICLRCCAHWDEDCLVGRLRGGCPYQERRTTPATRVAAKRTP
jgi:DNA-binding MarR family transcriptional regulator